MLHKMSLNMRMSKIKCNWNLSFKIMNIHIYENEMLQQLRLQGHIV